MANRSYREALALWFSEDRSDVTADNILDQDQCIRTLWHEAGRPALVGEQQQRETDAQRAAQLEQWLSARLEQHWAASIDGIGLGMAAHVNERLTELEEKIDRRFRVIDLPGKANNWKSTASASEVLDLPPLPRGDDLDD